MSNNKNIDSITKKIIQTNKQAGHHVPPEKVRAEVVRHARRRDIQGKSKR